MPSAKKKYTLRWTEHKPFYWLGFVLVFATLVSMCCLVYAVNELVVRWDYSELFSYLQFSILAMTVTCIGRITTGMKQAIKYRIARFEMNCNTCINSYWDESFNKDTHEHSKFLRCKMNMENRRNANEVWSYHDIHGSNYRHHILNNNKPCKYFKPDKKKITK